MSDHSPVRRTFDRDEAAMILREAAQLDEPAVTPTPTALPIDVEADGLSLADIEHAAAQVGIARSAVATASLSVALKSAHTGTARFHIVHEVAGELTADAVDRLASEIRTLVAPSGLRRTADGLDIEIGKPNGVPGSLLMQLRSKDGVTTMELWSHAPALTAIDLASCGLLGAPAALFPVVAVSGGAWPGLGAVVALATAGAVVGAGISVTAQRWRLDRWRNRLERIIVPVSTRIAELVRR